MKQEIFFTGGNLAVEKNKVDVYDLDFERQVVLKEGLEDRDDAREFIDECIKNDIKPIVTIPVEFADDVLKYGVHFVPKQDVKTGKKFSFIAGTIGIDPYLPEEQERLVLEIDEKAVSIEPRITGKEKRFYGVVGFVGGIPANSFKVLGKFSKKTWAEYSERTLN
jgi:hypothetical protein